MSKYIAYPKNESPSIQESHWTIHRDFASEIDSLGDGYALVSYEYWKLNQPALQAKVAQNKLGIYFTEKDDVLKEQDLIQHALNQVQIIAVDFPVFRDGRGFSTAAILREHYQWQKELRAIGDVLVDQFLQMARVGFDAFELRQDQNLELAISQLKRYPVRMQNDWRALRSTLNVVLA